LTWRDGSYYEGEFRNDRKHGKGVLVLTDSTKYEGSWSFGKLHGLVVLHKKEEVKRGEWNLG
jgi:hypothetical protein